MPDLPEGYVYEMGPNTDRWVGWMTPETAAAAGHDDPFAEDWSSDVNEHVEHAKEQFRARSSWEGDVREGPYVSGLMPKEPGNEFQLAVALKQDNNGWIFVWSPYELPWLRD